MITEDYVSFETAKLLKENGFNEGCHSAWLYNPKEDNSEYFVEYLAKGVENNTELEQFNEPDTDWAYSAPTLQMAMKWLRYEKNIHIKVHCSGHRNYLVYAQSLVTAFPDFCIESATCSFNTYEEAVEAAIKYCLTNLI